MINFRQIFLEDLTQDIRAKMNLGPEYSLYYNGKWVIDSFHKLLRDGERSLPKEVDKFFTTVIDYIVKNKSQGNKKYLFISKSSNLGAVIDYRKDEKHRVKGNNLVVVTWLGDVKKDLGKSPKDVFAKKGTDKILVECVGQFDYYVEI